jgi:hypothetical protein
MTYETSKFEKMSAPLANSMVDGEGDINYANSISKFEESKSNFSRQNTQKITDKLSYDTGQVERARFMATMKKNDNNKGNLPVEITINEGNKGNQLVFTQELLTFNNEEKQNIEIFYIKNFIIPLTIIVNGLLCFFIALLIYEKISTKRSIKRLVLLLVIIAIIDMWSMYILPDLNLLDHSLYVFYLAIPIYYVRKTDLWLTKSIVGFRSKR